MRTIPWATAVAALCAATSVSAQTPPAPRIQTQPLQLAEPARPAPAEERQAIGLDELGTLNGRQGDNTSIALSDQDLTAVNRGNAISANAVGSGQIAIDRSAFAGFAGVGNFVINSGHNNNLQGALTINIVTP